MSSESTHYLMDSPTEGRRLERKTDADETRRQLNLTGLRPGMSVLDAGCGTGAVARVMAELVGVGGSVDAVDASEDRLAQGRRLAEHAALENLSFIRWDLREGPVKTDTYDYVWSRFLFEYLEDPDQVLSHLVASTRVGGKVVVSDLDGNGLFHYPTTPELESGLSRFTRALHGRFDPFAGRKLYHRFRRQGLEHLQVHVLPYHLYPGVAPERDMANWEAKFETLAAIGHAAFGGSDNYDKWVRLFLDQLRNPDVFTYSTQIVVEGTRVR